ncbi:MAG: DUF5996 family protein [Pseudorhodoplanes sp.]|jgi:hypothetical protein|nr:DUF5996 family protein [Pseudorhodoplanes sp.]
MSDTRWPALPYNDWKETCATLHLWTQIVGKIRLAQTPWVNHSWHVPLYVTARGLTTLSIPHGARDFQIDFDFVDHVLWVRVSNGHSRQLTLRPMCVGDFYTEVFMMLSALGLDVSINERPNEIAEAIPFRDDAVHRSYDAEAAERFWRILLATHDVLSHFRSGFLGKVSPVHFFWGSFDLAVTRFSGRRAPAHPGGVPNLPDAVAREAYSHECSSAGFWPGGGGVIDEPAFYSYAYPAPKGFAQAHVTPAAAYFHKTLGEFILPYEAVRTANEPERMLMDFLQSSYDAAADLGKWDRANLDCELGAPKQVRPM